MNRPEISGLTSSDHCGNIGVHMMTSHDDITLWDQSWYMGSVEKSGASVREGGGTEGGGCTESGASVRERESTRGERESARARAIESD